MNSSTSFQQAFERARQKHTQGRFTEAEQAYQQLANFGEQRETVLRALVELYLQTRQTSEAIDTLVALTEEVPDKLYYYARLAGLLDGLGQTDAAIGHYQRLLKRQPGHAVAYFNVALLYKKGKRYSDALSAYEEAIKHGIDDVQEVYSNLGVLYSEMRQREKAREMYERALNVDPTYVPALFNLAGLFEEAGERQRARELYERILSINPNHWDSLARLAHAKKLTGADGHLIDSLRRATADAKDDPMAREGLYFALGKALDDLGQYEEAFAAYRSANQMGKLRNPPYDRNIVEQAFDRIIELFTPEWIGRVTTASTAAPIFVCGMFRSGSTLIEQILAGHPSITAGGELDYLPWLVAERLAPYPDGVISATREKLDELGHEYLSRLRTQFPDAQCITDKRPDNFLHLGLIKALFPSARIVYTRRNPVDNCLSVYFQQLGGNLSYATDLEDTAHYYRQHERLMAHWSSCFAEDIFTVDYDELVNSPEQVLRQLLHFLGFEWDDRCLTFQNTDSLVKTASVWQVREELHTYSSGRRRNYTPFVQDIQALLL